MEPMRQGKRAWEVYALWGVAIVFFFCFSYLIPKVCDDWIFTARFNEAPDHGGLIGAVIHEYQTLNGRILGNGLSILLSGSKLLRTVFKTAVFLITLYAIGKLTRMDKRGGFGWAAAFIVMFLVPAELRKQTYAWDSGLVNYLVPMALLLLYFLIIAPLFSGQRVQDSPWTGAVCLVLGLSVQLFAENITAYVLVMALGVFIWHIIATKKVSVNTALFLLGAVAGIVLMLSSPTYRGVMAGGDTYRSIPTNLGQLLERIKSNYQPLSTYSFGGDTLLHLILSGSAIALLSRSGDAQNRWVARLKKALPVLLSVLPVYFYATTRIFDYVELESSAFLALTRIFGSIYSVIALDLLFYALYVAALGCVLIFFVQGIMEKRLGLFCIASALIVSGPMLFVWPIDYRCFLPSYLFWTMVSLLLLDAALTKSKVAPGREPGLLKQSAFAVSAAVCVCNLAIYSSCPKLERTRVQYIQQQMSIQADIIVLPEFDCEPYLHYPTTLMGEVYYYDTPGDIEMPFIPYESWNEEFSHGLPPAQDGGEAGPSTIS